MQRQFTLLAHFLLAQFFSAQSPVQIGLRTTNCLAQIVERRLQEVLIVRPQAQFEMCAGISQRIKCGFAKLARGRLSI